MSTKWPRKTLCFYNQVMQISQKTFTLIWIYDAIFWSPVREFIDTLNYNEYTKQFYLICSILRWQLWNPGSLPLQLGWFLSSYTGLWIQTRPELHCVPHCALYWGSVHNFLRTGAGTYSALQTSLPPCPDPWSWFHDWGWPATWRVSLSTLLNIQPAPYVFSWCFQPFAICLLDLSPLSRLSVMQLQNVVQLKQYRIPPYMNQLINSLKHSFYNERSVQFLMSYNTIGR